MNRHPVLLATCEALDSDGEIVAEYSCRITYSFTAGRPATMYERNGDPGHPADPSEWEVIKVEVDRNETKGKPPRWVEFVKPDPFSGEPDFKEWATDYLDENDGERVFAHQIDMHDEAMEQRAERRADDARDDALARMCADCEPF